MDVVSVRARAKVSCLSWNWRGRLAGQSCDDEFAHVWIIEKDVVPNRIVGHLVPWETRRNGKTGGRGTVTLGGEEWQDRGHCNRLATRWIVAFIVIEFTGLR
jgi:hypothetical protein